VPASHTIAPSKIACNAIEADNARPSFLPDANSAVDGSTRAKKGVTVHAHGLRDVRAPFVAPEKSTARARCCHRNPA
jgi:hypothetical protein